MKCKICGREYSTAGGTEHIGCPGKKEKPKQGEKVAVGDVRVPGEGEFKKGFEGKK